MKIQILYCHFNKENFCLQENSSPAPENLSRKKCSEKCAYGAQEMSRNRHVKYSFSVFHSCFGLNFYVLYFNTVLSAAPSDSRVGGCWV